MEPLLILSKLASYRVAQLNLTQLNEGRTYQIGSILKNVCPNPRILYSSPFQNNLSQNYQRN